MASTANIRRFGHHVKARGLLSTLKTLTAATTCMNSHAGRTNLLSAVAGFTVTLPAAKGTGNTYRFLVKTTLTSANYIIKVANSTDVMVGGILINDIGDTSAATADFFPTASTSDTITLPFATGAGKAGDWVELEDYAAGFWAVRGQVQGMTDPATPFSATV
jgi:hypothetical protein